MTSSPRGGAVCALLALLILLALPGAARAADTVTGGTSITLDGTAAKALKRAGVRFVAIEPASVTRTTLTLPASTATIGTVARAYHSGVVQLVHGKGRKAKRVAVTGAQTRLAAARSYTTARLGRTKVTLLQFGAVEPVLDAKAGTARLKASVSLTDRAARGLVRRLGIKRFAVRRLGTATFAISKPAPVAPPAPASSSAPAAVAGNVGAASFTWRPRESFVRYINAEPGNGIFATEGATAGPAEVRPPSTAPLVYAFQYPFTGGNAADGSTLLTFGGRVSFSWPNRGIDLQFANPQLSFGPQPSASFVLAGATSGTRNGQLTRALDLNLAGAASHTVDGATETYVDVPATLTAEGAEGFAGFYPAGTEFGTVSATWTRTP